jgi:hypothetical protein
MLYEPPTRGREMDQLRSSGVQYRIDHRHKDGSWAEMAEDRQPHDAADVDAERFWGVRRLFRCRTCDESVMLEPGDGAAQPQ